jgi:signal transduction histidine kinase
MTAMFNRTHQAALLTLLIGVCLGSAIVGFAAAIDAPIPTTDTDKPFSELDIAAIEAIAGIPVEKHFFLRFPEFFRRSDEDRWWQAHQHMYAHLQTIEQISVVHRNTQGQAVQTVYRLKSEDTLRGLKRLGLIYVAAVLYILNALSVFVKHRDKQGSTLAFFFLFCALYFICGAPVVSRSITLNPIIFKIMINFLYIASSGLILIVYYAFIFPEPKRVLARLPFPAFLIFCGHAVITSTLYITRLISFGATLPNLIFWVCVAIAGFLHSLLTVKERFLKKQIGLTIFVPVLASTVFVAFNILPAALGGSAMRFTSFALFSLIVPFSLSAALDNMHFYQQRIASAAKAKREKERLRQDLHDDTLNRLANICLLSDVLVGSEQGSSPDLAAKLTAIKKQATTAAGRIRDMLWITDDRYRSWQDFGSQLRSQGYELTSGRKMQFNFVVSALGTGVEPPTIVEKTCLYYVFVEAISNAIKHSGANNIWVRLTAQHEIIVLQVKDDGRGIHLNPDDKSGFGLANIRRRVAQLDGKVTVDNSFSQGLALSITLKR